MIVTDGRNDGEKKDKRVIPLLGIRVTFTMDGQLDSVSLLELQTPDEKKKRAWGGSWCEARKTQLKWSTDESSSR